MSFARLDTRPSIRRTLVTLAALVLAAMAFSACSDDEDPNAKPELLADSITVTCEASAVSNQGDLLIGGELQLIDDDPMSVTVSVDGLEAIALSPTNAEPDPKLPQTWAYTVDPERGIVCSSELLLTYRIEDGHGEVVTVTRPAM